MQSLLYIGTNQSALDNELNKLKDKLKVSQFNYIEYFPSPSIGIDIVRKIKEILTLKPFGGNNRLMVVKEMDKATLQAQNALLKILEEPPANTYIALTTKNVSALLPTIVSRCQLVTVKGEKTKVMEDDNATLKLLKGIIKSSPGQRLLLAAQYSKTKEVALDILDQLLILLQSLLHDSTEIKLTTSQIASTLAKVESAKRYIERNINYKATLDILFLGFPKAKLI